MRNAMNPYGGVNPLIDKMIGNAYDIVKYVAKYLKEIRYVAENMQYVYAAANGNKVTFSGAGDGTTSLSVAIPLSIMDNYNDDVFDNVFAVGVMAVTSSGMVYFPGADTYNFGLDPSGLVVISITGGGSVPALLTAEYRVTVTMNTPPAAE